MQVTGQKNNGVEAAEIGLSSSSAVCAGE